MSARHLILLRLEHGGPASRSQLRDELQLPIGTVLRSAHELIEAGCIRVSSTHEPVYIRGRSVQVLEVVP
jgi:DNA-binding MarR family transcriptional regulator